jgi:hypothetical protein
MAPLGEPTYDGPSERPKQGQVGKDVMAKKFDELRLLPIATIRGILGEIA